VKRHQYPEIEAIGADGIDGDLPPDRQGLDLCNFSASGPELALDVVVRIELSLPSEILSWHLQNVFARTYEAQDLRLHAPPPVAVLFDSFATACTSGEKVGREVRLSY